MRLARLASAAVLVVLSAPYATCPAEEVDPRAAFFDQSVLPVLEANCLGCHGGAGPDGKARVKAGLRLTSRAHVLQGGDRGPAVDLENPAGSLLLAMISYKDELHQMPPRGKLSQQDSEILQRWVLGGLPWGKAIDAPPAGEHHEERNIEEAIRKAAASDWAYQKVNRPEVPRVNDASWQKRPIDAFIAHRLQDAGLEPNPLASKRALARRAHYDVTGLPPTPAEVEAFVSDESPKAWESLVDRLLASQQFGEKWARHWLDIVRYAESNGYERDSDKNEIWRYRDYVIRAFNDDKPYDRFILEQLAGDELSEVTADSIVATGFHRLHLWDDEPADRLQARYDNLDDIVRTASEGFLGITLGCARCHDHKADPLSQRDYYSFMAFFNNLTPMGKGNVFRSLEGLARNRAAAAKVATARAELETVEQQVQVIETEARAKLRAKDPQLVALGSFQPGQVLVPDARREAHVWRYTTRRPPNEWMTNGYSAANDPWRDGKSGFGRNGTPGAKVRTDWHQREIWLRTTFPLTAIPPSLDLAIHHDEDVQVYLNGERIAELKGHRTDYTVLSVPEAGLRALQTGKNVLAVYCRQTGGGQYVDVGLSVGKDGPRIDQIVRQHAEIVGADLVAKYDELQTKHDQLQASITANEGGGRAMCAAERGTSAPEQHVHLRGSAHARGDRVEPAFPAVLKPPAPAIKPTDGIQSTGRRTALARWMASPDNPLTARVKMNRLWQHYFGRGIVATPSDFGRLGIAPTHPQLLDWLAAEFMSGGWKLKRMHKMMLMSRAYRMSSRAQERGLAKDPANQLFWRHDMRRLSAEEVRDTVLAVSGNLNRKSFGPSMFPDLPPEVLATSSTGAGKWGRSSPEDRVRRSIYIKVKRSLQVPMLTDFDFADTDAPCAVRFSSTVPTQALGMLNGKFVNDQADVFAERLRRERPNDLRAQMERGLELVTGRQATEDEVSSCVSFTERLRKQDGLDDAALLSRFALLALNLNELIYLD